LDFSLAGFETLLGLESSCRDEAAISHSFRQIEPQVFSCVIFPESAGRKKQIDVKRYRNASLSVKDK
jgi:hypothetical protein